MAVAFGIYFVLYALRAMGAGDVKLMAAVGAMVGWEHWFGIFIFTAIIGGIMALILVVAANGSRRPSWNVGFILSEMKSGRPAYLAKEELDVKNPKALGLPHGAVIAVGTLFFLALSAHYTAYDPDERRQISCKPHSSKEIRPSTSGPAFRCRPVPGQVQIRVAYCGICGTDLHLFHGAMAHRLTLPQVMGHEMSGDHRGGRRPASKASAPATASPCARSTPAATAPPAAPATATSART